MLQSRLRLLQKRKHPLPSQFLQAIFKVRIPLFFCPLEDFLVRFSFFSFLCPICIFLHSCLASIYSASSKLLNLGTPFRVKHRFPHSSPMSLIQETLQSFLLLGNHSELSLVARSFSNCPITPKLTALLKAPLENTESQISETMHTCRGEERHVQARKVKSCWTVSRKFLLLICPFFSSLPLASLCIGTWTLGGRGSFSSTLLIRTPRDQVRLPWLKKMGTLGRDFQECIAWDAT